MIWERETNPRSTTHPYTSTEQGRNRNRMKTKTAPAKNELLKVTRCARSAYDGQGLRERRRVGLRTAPGTRPAEHAARPTLASPVGRTARGTRPAEHAARHGLACRRGRAVHGATKPPIRGRRPIQRRRFATSTFLARARRVFRPRQRKCSGGKRHRREAVRVRAPVLAVRREHPLEIASERGCSLWPVPPVGPFPPVVPSVPRVSLLRVGRLCGGRSLRPASRCPVVGSWWPLRGVRCGRWPVVRACCGSGFRGGASSSGAGLLRRGLRSCPAIAPFGRCRACLRRSCGCSSSSCRSSFAFGRSFSGAERPRDAALGDDRGAAEKCSSAVFFNFLQPATAVCFPASQSRGPHQRHR